MTFNNPKSLGTIESISQKFAAYENWPATAIVPFSKEDVLKAMKEGRLESRSFQDPYVTKELNDLNDRLSANNIPIPEKDIILKEWARNFHISRVAFLALNFPATPITLNSDMQVVDGWHRIMAAIVIDKISIEYILENIGNQ